MSCQVGINLGGPLPCTWCSGWRWSRLRICPHCNTTVTCCSDSWVSSLQILTSRSSCPPPCRRRPAPAAPRPAPRPRSPPAPCRRCRTPGPRSPSLSSPLPGGAWCLATVFSVCSVWWSNHELIFLTPTFTKTAKILSKAPNTSTKAVKRHLTRL